MTYVGLHSLALPVFGSFWCLTLACISISDEDSLSEMALSDASKLASTYFSLLYRSVHVLYSISSPIRHTCSVHILSKFLMRIYHILVQTHISPQSKITEVHQNKKDINNMF